MLRTGRRDRYILIQRATISSGSYGDPIKTWATHFTAWAEVVFLSGTEMMKSGREISAKAATFRIPFHSDLKTSDRISWGGQFWDIESIREIGRREGLEIFASVNEIEVGG